MLKKTQIPSSTGSADHQKIQRYQEGLNQLIASKISFSTTADLMEASLKYLLKSLDVPIGVINLLENVYVNGITLDAETTMSVGIKIDVEKFTKTILVEDWREEDAAFINLSTMMNSLNIRSSVITPILRAEQRIGYLCVSSSLRRTWQEDEIRMVDLTSEYLGSIVDEIQTNEETRSIPVLLKRLQKISGTMNRILTFDESLTMIGQGAVQLLSADQAAIFLRNPDAAFNLVWLYELSETRFDQVVTKEEQEITSYLLTLMSPVIFTEITKSGLPAHLMEYLSDEGIKSLNLMPLVFEEVVIGTVLLLYKAPLEVLPHELEILSSYANLAAITLQNSHMYEQLESGYLEVALALAAAMDERETKVTAKNIQIANWAEDTARSLGCSSEEIEEIRWAALLHNIGKSEIPDAVLSKPGPLSDKEWHIVYQHPVKGEQRVKPLTRFSQVGIIIRNCRERYDGDGYPDHLMGENIPLGSRVIAVADTYGSLLDERPYRPAHSHRDAVLNIQHLSGLQFDPQVVENFVRLVDAEYGGN